MFDLSTEYMGLKLKSPVIVSSSKLTGTEENLKKCQDSDAGAVVLKSVFEEQIMSEKSSLLGDMDMFQHADAYDFFNKSGENFVLDEYLGFIEKARKQISIPVIASLNCVSAGNWLEYAKRIQNVGADALEINMYIMPSDAEVSGVDIEKRYLEVAHKLRDALDIPIAMKLGYNFSGMANFLTELDKIGIDGLVLFNRFYNIDFNIETEKLVAGNVFSSRDEIYNTLRWTALMSGELKADIASNTGIHTSEDVIKMILAGAKAVEMCSILYNKGLDYIKVLHNEVRDWMRRHEYNSLDEFCGNLCQERSRTPGSYERAQYIKTLTGLE